MTCPSCGQEVPEISRRQFCPFCGVSLAPQLTPAPETPDDAAHDAAADRPSFYCPWEDRDRLGFVPALSQTWTESVLRPSGFFKKMPRTGGIGAPMLYAVLIGTIGALFSLFWEFLFIDKLTRLQNWPADMPIEMSRNVLVLVVPLIPLLLIISMLIMSFVYHVCLMITGSAKNGWEATFRVIAYASGPSVLLLLPMCGGIFAAAWSWFLQVIGWTEAHESSAARVTVAALLPFFACCGLLVWLVARFASLFKNLELPAAMLQDVVRSLH